MAPWVHLRNVLTSRGITVHTADFLNGDSEASLNLYVSIGNLKNYRRIARRKDIIMSAFFAMECPIVEPSLYKGLGHVQHYFKRIFSWSDSQALEHFTGGSLPLIPYLWPQSFNDVHEPIWERTDRKFLVMINSNKLPAVYWRELYTERLRAIEYFSRTGEIDLYGNHWDKPSLRLGRTWIPATAIRLLRVGEQLWQRFQPDPYLTAARSVYRGRAQSKSETLGQYTFALCFENMILKGWITEKIFDCFFTGTIPIYWGAPNIEEHIPMNCFIDMRKFSGYGELRDFLKSLSERDIRAYRENARQFLLSPKYKPFTKEAFADLFTQIVEADVESTRG